jgi:hypothetical protein
MSCGGVGGLMTFPVPSARAAGKRLEDKMSAEIPLTKGKYAVIDNDDFKRVSKYKWCLDGRYAKGYVNGKQIRLHVFVTNAKLGEEIDHINGDGLDNRKCNLRVCTKSQNQMNKGIILNHTGYKGVHSRKSGLFYAQIWVGKNIHLGSFKTAKEAADAYDEAALQVYGSFAKTNRSIYEQRIG